MSQPVKASSRRSIFRTGIGQAGLLISVILLGAGLAPIFFGLGFRTLFTISAEPNIGLQNIGNLGQFLSGLFAPVAFVWVVIAVILQGRELELQREELKDTREVFNLRKDEMKRAADETREQTRIMTENLKAEAERKLYNEIDTRLYSLSLYIIANRNNATIVVGGGSYHFVNIHHEFASTINRNNFDQTFILFLNSTKNFLNTHRERMNILTPGPQATEFFTYVHKELSSIFRTKINLENNLVASRLLGLQIPHLLENLDQIGNAAFVSRQS